MNHREFRSITKEVTKQIAVPYEDIKVGWCLEFPPRCPKVKVLYRNQNRTEIETSIVQEKYCCHGYIEDNNGCFRKFLSNIFCIFLNIIHIFV